MSKNFPASLDSLYEMLFYIRNHLTNSYFDESIVSKIELACEESLVNIISYAYPQGSGDIEISCTSSNEGILIVIKDHGTPYNPLTNAKKIKEKLTEDHTLGGYGIFFMLNIMDEINYKREDNKNILSLIKFFPKKKADYA